MAPGLFGPMAMKALGPAPAPVNEGPMNPALLTAAQQAQMPAFDPYQNAGRMVGLGIPAEAIAQAMAELGLSRS